MGYGSNYVGPVRLISLVASAGFRSNHVENIIILRPLYCEKPQARMERFWRIEGMSEGDRER